MIEFLHPCELLGSHLLAGTQSDVSQTAENVSKAFLAGTRCRECVRYLADWYKVRIMCQIRCRLVQSAQNVSDALLAGTNSRDCVSEVDESLQSRETVSNTFSAGTECRECVRHVVAWY